MQFVRVDKCLNWYTMSAILISIFLYWSQSTLKGREWKRLDITNNHEPHKTVYIQLSNT